MKRIALLKGGWSSERDVSLRSGANVGQCLRNLGYDVYEIDVIKDLRFITNELYKADPDYVFNALHGTGGEDGVIQGLLEIFGVPYSNSNVLGSSIAFDKEISKRLAESIGVRTANAIYIHKDDIKDIDADSPPLQYPFVVKPCANGSSVGVSIIHTADDLQKVQNTSWEFGDSVMLEKYVGGREFTVLVINGRAIGSVEIISKNEFYDYASKYDDDGSKHLTEFDLPKEQAKQMYRMSESAFKVCKCRGIARIDFLYDGSYIYFIEINTQPGLTDVSLVPDISRFNGISLEELLTLDIKQLV